MTFVLRTYVSRQAPPATRCFGRGARWTAPPRTRTGGFARPVRSTTPSTCRGSRNGWRRSAPTNVGPEMGGLELLRMAVHSRQDEGTHYENAPGILHDSRAP